MKHRKWTVVALFLGMTLIAAACGGDDGADNSGGSGSGDGDSLGEVKVVWSSELQAYVPQVQGPWRYASEFGLDIQEDDIQAFDSHATAAQVLISGRADVIGGSFANVVQLREQGQDVKVFCPVQAKTTEHLVGVGITDLADITQPDVVVGIDSPGGLINYLMNHVFRARGITNEQGETLTVDDLKNVKILEDGGLRLAALAAQEINVGSLDVFEQAELKKQVGDTANATVLSVTAEDIDQALGNTYSAKTEWIEEDPDRAAAFCASVLKANRELAADYEMYKEWANHLIDPDPDNATLRGNWDFVREHEVWPYNSDVLNQEAFDVDMEVLVATGLLKDSALDVPFEDAVDLSVAEAAVELLGGPVEASEILGSG